MTIEVAVVVSAIQWFRPAAFISDLCKKFDANSYYWGLLCCCVLLIEISNNDGSYCCFCHCTVVTTGNFHLGLVQIVRHKRRNQRRLKLLLSFLPYSGHDRRPSFLTCANRLTQTVPFIFHLGVLLLNTCV